MQKARPLFLLVLLGAAIGGSSSPSRGEDGKLASDAPPPEQAVISAGRRTTFVPEYLRLRTGTSDAISVTRDAQKELQRVGCYDGEINGVWTRASQEAALLFLARINAKLPVDKPDDVLLELLRSSKDRSCGSCPRGQESDATGHCAPTALIGRPTAPFVTGSLPRAPDAAPAHTSGKSSSAPQAVESESAAPGGQRRQPTSSGSWGNFIRKVDRALGLN
jgi:hypothetical protein